MQIHAVPESERFVDSNGRRLPWAYDYTSGEQQDEQEKGPFGRNSRRSRNNLSRSRSKTTEPRREEDRHRAENAAAEDAVFGSLRRHVSKDDGRRDTASERDAALSAARGMLVEEQEPTEVLLYGFGEELQWAAIDHYERVSMGHILEDYDRQPPSQRYDISRSLGRAGAQASLSRAALRKRNTYAGGRHWIKVTFNSRQTAELAIARGPHIIKGYLVYAEPYQNRGPPRDEAVFATQAGVQVTSDVLPPTFSTDHADLSPNGSSTTATSATVTGTDGRVGSQRTNSRFGREEPSASADLASRGARPERVAPAASQVMTESSRGMSTAVNGTQGPTKTFASIRKARIEGTTPALVLPADMALAPKQPKASWSSWVGASEIIGAAVPRKEDGGFDWQKASLYWRIFFWIDMIFGTDFCGLRADE